MTDDTTTIEITEDQRDELKALKAHDRESYKSVIGRLLEDDGNEEDVGGGMPNLSELADAAGSCNDIPDDLNERISRIESAASTAEERTGSIQNTLESAGLGR